MIISTVEMHTGGEPTRIIVDGWPKLLGKTLLDKRRDFAVKLRFPDIARVVKIFIRHHPDRLMWGSNLPDQSGLELCRRLRSASERTSSTGTGCWRRCGSGTRSAGPRP